MTVISTAEIVNFKFAMTDVQVLLDLHDDLTERARGRPDPKLEVFKRSAVILSITAWETFVEDTIRSAATQKILNAKEPSEVQGTFRAVAAFWLESSKLKPADLSAWTGEGWKARLIEKLTSDLADLNTPKTENVRALSRRYLGLDITQSWRWKNATQKNTTERLDALITLRGALVHRGPSMLENAAVKRHHVVMALELLPRLAACTEKALGRQPQNVQP